MKKVKKVFTVYRVGKITGEGHGPRKGTEASQEPGIKVPYIKLKKLSSKQGQRLKQELLKVLLLLMSLSPRISPSISAILAGRSASSPPSKALRTPLSAGSAADALARRSSST